VKHYIPPRSTLPQHVGGVEWALEDFRQQAATIAGQLVSELRELQEAGELSSSAHERGGGVSAGVREGSSTRKSETEERCVSMTLLLKLSALSCRKHKFIFHLNSSGKYHAIKEQLKVYPLVSSDLADLSC
jgi:hypothetical protein